MGEDWLGLTITVRIQSLTPGVNSNTESWVSGHQDRSTPGLSSVQERSQKFVFGGYKFSKPIVELIQ